MVFTFDPGIPGFPFDPGGPISPVRPLEIIHFIIIKYKKELS